MPLSVNTLTRLGVPAEKARRHLPHLTAAMRRFDITTQRRAECFLAQLFHESGTLRYFEELASGAAYEGRRDLGNTRRGDGRRYKGRGPIQLTGRANYRTAGAALGVDFEARPKLVATPRYGYRVAAWYWSSRGLNALADQNRFEDITRRINGAAKWGAPSHHGRRVDLRKRIGAYDVRPGEDAIARGAKGDAVERLTRRLSLVRSASSGAPYLDGKRRKFDRDTERSLKRFQREHGLAVDGEYGPESRKALARAVARYRGQQGRRPAVHPTAAQKPAAKQPARSGAQLIAQLSRLDSRRDEALDVVIRRGARLERLVAKREERNRTPDSATLRELAELRRLDAMIGEVRGTLADATRAPAEQAVAVAAAEPDGQANGGAPDGASEPAGDQPTFAEVAARLTEHDARGDAMRAAVAKRLIALEARAGKLAPKREHRRDGHTRPNKRKPACGMSKPDRGVTYKLSTPLMKSPQVAAFQRRLNRRFADWRVRCKIAVDGEYGPETREAVRRVVFGMGMSTKQLEHGVTPQLRERIRHPERRTAAERARARKRRPWIRRLRRRYDGHGPAAAIAYARKHLGVKEDPGRPNRGRIIDKWNRATGIPLNAYAYWCGAFVNGCLIATGFAPDRVLAYCPYIEDRAKQGRDGWSWHSKPRRGDLALFTHRSNDGRLVAGHVGIVERVENGAVVTIEGNTSPNGTSNNGYGVFRRHRKLPIRGFARPPYER